MSESNPQVRGVIFDMDGVLCDSEPFIYEAACRLFAERYGVEVKPGDFIPFVGTGENRYLGGVAEKYNIQLDIEADKQRTYEIYLQIIQGRLQPLPGVHYFITLCRQHNLRLAVATSADRIKMEGNLREIGLTPDSFDACVTGNDIERKKPHPDIFLQAAARLGLAAGACLVIEDAPNGIEAAKAAGAWCLGLTSSFSAEHLRSAGADWIAPDLAQVPHEVLNLITGSLTTLP